MADPVASVEKIVKIGLKIKQAVDTVRKNKEVCLEIRKRVLRFSDILSQLQQTGMLNNNPAMSGPLEDLEETLERGLELVTSCQERRSTIRRFITAGDLSKQLREVKDDILNKVMLASFAINTNTTIMLFTIHAGIRPDPLRQPEESGLMEISHDNHSSEDIRSDIHYANISLWFFMFFLQHKRKLLLLNNAGNGRSEQNGEENSVPGGSEALLPPLAAITLREFGLSELKAATNGFSDSNIIGRGGIATVYKGVLDDQSVIAIKKFRWAPRLGWAHTYEQLLLASKLQHKNVVQVLGYSHENGAVKDREYIWVEEYVPMGTLHEIIHCKEPRLDWSSLIRIIEGIAQGVRYLHEQCVVHLDLKPTNIVLDSHMNPKITDFEVAKVLNGNQLKGEIITAGTFQYIAPEYLTDGVVSMMNDVYGFGVTLLETVSGIRRRHNQPREFHLHRWVRADTHHEHGSVIVPRLGRLTKVDGSLIRHCLPSLS
nr:cysteine-rich receptor-like protein kinase 40 isoform X3 [Setaria viridis]